MKLRAGFKQQNTLTFLVLDDRVKKKQSFFTIREGNNTFSFESGRGQFMKGVELLKVLF